MKLNGWQIFVLIFSVVCLILSVISICITLKQTEKLSVVTSPPSNLENTLEIPILYSIMRLQIDLGINNKHYFLELDTGSLSFVINYTNQFDVSNCPTMQYISSSSDLTGLLMKDENYINNVKTLLAKLNKPFAQDNLVYRGYGSGSFIGYKFDNISAYLYSPLPDSTSYNAVKFLGNPIYALCSYNAFSTGQGGIIGAGYYNSAFINMLKSKNFNCFSINLKLNANNFEKNSTTGSLKMSNNVNNILSKEIDYTQIPIHIVTPQQSFYFVKLLDYELYYNNQNRPIIKNQYISSPFNTRKEFIANYKSFNDLVQKFKFQSQNGQNYLAWNTEINITTGLQDSGNLEILYSNDGNNYCTLTSEPNFLNYVKLNYDGNSFIFKYASDYFKLQDPIVDTGTGGIFLTLGIQSSSPYANPYKIKLNFENNKSLIIDNSENAFGIDLNSSFGSILGTPLFFNYNNIVFDLENNNLHFGQSITSPSNA